MHPPMAGDVRNGKARNSPSPAHRHVVDVPAAGTPLVRFRGNPRIDPRNGNCAVDGFVTTPDLQAMKAVDRPFRIVGQGGHDWPHYDTNQPRDARVIAASASTYRGGEPSKDGYQGSSR